MAALNLSHLTTLAVIVDLADTGAKVAQDPPVRKAADQFRVDAIQAAKSGKELVTEVHDSWKRHRSA